MPVVGLVLNLAPPVKASLSDVSDQLAMRDDVELGTLNGSKLPAVLDVPVGEDAEARIEALLDLTGLLTVDVVYAHFEDAILNNPEASSPGDGEEIK